MLTSVKIKNDEVLITKNESTVYKIKVGDVLCSVGIGDAKYKMSHGSFKHKEINGYTNDLTVKSINKKDNEINIILSDSTKKSVINLSISSFNETTLKFNPKIICAEKLNRISFKIPAMETEAVYGTGETFTELNLRGHVATIWVAEHINASQMAKKIMKKALGRYDELKKQPFENYESYYVQPTFISSNKYFFHSDSTAYARFDFTNKRYHSFFFREIAPFYIGFSNTYESLMSDLTLVVGRQNPIPDWCFDGMILGIQGGTDVVLKKLDTMKKKDTAICGVWCQDWGGRKITAVGKQVMWNWQLKTDYYNDFEKIIKLKDDGIHFLSYINPFLDTSKPLYEIAHKKGYCVKNSKGEDYMATVTTFPAAMVDFTNKDAYDWYKGIIKDNMLSLGIDGWMADFSEYLPPDSVLASGEAAELVHNTWPARWAKCNMEALQETGKSNDVLYFTRAGYTDTCKYSMMMWSGDQHVDNSVDFGLPSVIPSTLSLSCSGFGICHSDVGGFTTFLNVKRSANLLMRWAEMNAFSPLMRSHEGLNPDMNVQFDDENVSSHIARQSRIHRALKPYIKALCDENCKNGIPVIRPLFFYYDEKETVNEYTEYLLGRDILVAPILEKDEMKREVYFPNDEWVHLWSEKTYKKGRCIISSPLGEMPVFIRKSSDYLDEFLKLKEV